MRRPLLVIPAIDILDGRCVRLHQGSYDHSTVYLEDPVQMARLWRVQNARTLHVVDLNAARGDVEQTRKNREIIARICEVLDIPVQVGGGIRTMEDISTLLNRGVYRVILGTAAIRTPALVEEAIRIFGAHRIAVGLDARDGEVRIQGWLEGSGRALLEVAQEMEERGCRRLIVTDISRDGTLQGVAIETYRTLASVLQHVRITASGGVSGYADLKALAEVAPGKVDSVIIGKALYENAFPCQQFWCWHHLEKVDLTQYSTARLRC